MKDWAVLIQFQAHHVTSSGDTYFPRILFISYSLHAEYRLQRPTASFHLSDHLVNSSNIVTWMHLKAYFRLKGAKATYNQHYGNGVLGLPSNDFS